MRDEPSLTATPRHGKRLALGAALAAVLLAGVLAAYLPAGLRAKERKGAAQPAAVPVSVAAVEQRTMPVRLTAIGNVDAYNTVALKARVDGQIVAVNFREGQAVRKGEVLFRLDPRPFDAALHQAEANLARDRANLDHADMQQRRYAELLHKNFVSQDAYAQYRTNAETATASLKASEAAVETARLNLQYCTIRSPIDGYVGRVMLQLGNMVKANDTNPLVVINQVQPVYVTFAVPEQRLAELRRHMAGGPLAVTVTSPDAGHAPRQTGKLVFVDNAVDQSTGTIKLRAQFDNRDLALWPGQFVNVSLKLYDQSGALVVPALAVQTGPQGEFVFVLKPDATTEVRKVAIARTEGDLAVVAEGLAKGEKVVTRGQLRLAPGVKVVVRPDAS
ncbi:MAG TPA: efflux RND transporter periplasmic adaptor subunit [Burkholderiales bacterium]|nr:efflux RND transporter periplasmic adaptor subunit [Burkholderiales bacterium]